MAKDDADYTCMTIDDNITGIYGMKFDCTSRSLNKSDNANCMTYSLLSIYDYLKNELRENVVFVGIDKGGGESNTDGRDLHGNCLIRKNTVSIYKLNMSKPVRIMNLKCYYNPYFSRFFEDIAFNSEISYGEQIKSMKFVCFRLNFGHFQVKAATGKSNAQKTCESLINAFRRS